MVYKNETITVANSAIGFTTANIDLPEKLYGRSVKQIVFTLAAAQIRIWEDGTDPTSAIGQIININDVVTIDGHNAKQFRAIRTGGTSGIISVAYEI